MFICQYDVTLFEKCKCPKILLPMGSWNQIHMQTESQL